MTVGPVTVHTAFRCDVCHDHIPDHKARVHCQSCPDLDMCASCFVIGASSGTHAPHHPTTVIKQSGGIQAHTASTNINPSVPSESVSPIYADERRHSTFSQTASSASPVEQRQYTPQSPSSATGQGLYFPPPPTAPSVSRRPVPTIRSPSISSQPAPGPAPPLPPRPTPPGAATSPPIAGWQPLFDGNIASPTFTRLLNDIFTYLDPQNTGHLTPEVYSSFLDAQGYKLEANAWKKSLTAVFGQNKEDVADRTFKDCLDNFSIEHIMAPRPARPNNDMSNLMSGMDNMLLNTPAMRSIMQASQPASISGGQMPLLTRKGFIDITSVEVLCDPSLGWGNLNRALRAYGIWGERGPIPREMLPAFPPQEVLDHVKRVMEQAQLKAETALANQRIYNNMQRDAHRHCEELTSDVRYRYY